METATPAQGGRAGQGQPGRLGNVVRWLFGVALFTGVILVISRGAEERQFLSLLVRSHPGWLVAAGVLQSLTYVAQGGVWAAVLARTRKQVPLADLVKLSVGKFFVDQAIPSAGISGTLLIVRGLERRGLERGPVMACVVVETITNFVSFGLAVMAALGIAAATNRATPLVTAAALAFIAVSAVVIAAVVSLARGRTVPLPRLASRIPGMRPMLDALAQAPPRLTHDRRVIVEGTALNLAIHLLDAATLWTLLRAVSASASPAGVFAAFMLSTVARTVGVSPGGLGTFEAASVATLHLFGVPIGPALAATVLFRGFSFWLPMPPGIWWSRAEAGRS